MSTDIPKVHAYTDAWRWPDGVERFIREQCDEDARVLNCPCGASRLGDVLIDAEPQSDEIIDGDMFDLLEIVEPCSFDVAISDPPWKSMSYFDRWDQFFQLVRAVKPGGYVIYNATWEPHSDQTEVVGRYRRADGAFRTISQITVYQRYPGQTTFADLEP